MAWTRTLLLSRMGQPIAERAHVADIVVPEDVARRVPVIFIASASAIPPDRRFVAAELRVLWKTNPPALRPTGKPVSDEGESRSLERHDARLAVLALSRRPRNHVAVEIDEPPLRAVQLPFANACS